MCTANPGPAPVGSTFALPVMGPPVVDSLPLSSLNDIVCSGFDAELNVASLNSISSGFGFPDESETLLHPANYVLGCFVGRQPSRVRCPTAAGPTGVSYRIRVHDPLG